MKVIEDLLSCLHKSATGPYSKRDESSPQPHVLFREDTR
jgi:hypothetical protein